MKTSPRIDLNTRAFNIVQQITSDHPVQEKIHAINGRLGGLKGGVARAEKLSPRKRRQISIKANKARWKKTS